VAKIRFFFHSLFIILVKNLVKAHFLMSFVSWKPCFQWVERLLPKSGKEASDGWKLTLKKGMNKTA